ncbi:MULTISPECIES: hypothetical protein [unclassified Chelatococcus]|uniref:hypothetical protein n=1 Tax=unclassified Chelatococcus TaxID=2638111 RepID=UPI001BCE9AB7|nr:MULTISPECIES: hypothetical protein [unclassified Chelatococcus]MBS7698334.1 hypothetical protein [Chelatococcus sp. YT9]MBX3559191.1 hypothetical protein [Chelatococcus sp.]
MTEAQEPYPEQHHNDREKANPSTGQRHPCDRLLQRYASHSSTPHQPVTLILLTWVIKHRNSSAATPFREALDIQNEPRSATSKDDLKEEGFIKAVWMPCERDGRKGMMPQWVSTLLSRKVKKK